VEIEVEKKKKNENEKKKSSSKTHGFRSLGLRRRFTSANLRVFLALPITGMRVGCRRRAGDDGGKGRERSKCGDDGCLLACFDSEKSSRSPSFFLSIAGSASLPGSSYRNRSTRATCSSGEKKSRRRGEKELARERRRREK